MAITRRATITITFAENLPIDTRLKVMEQLEQGPIAVSEVKGPETPLGHLLRNLRVGLTLQLKPSTESGIELPPGTWLGREAVVAYFCRRFGYSKPQARASSRTLVIAQALARFAADQGVTVICSKCHKRRKECPYHGAEVKPGSNHPCASGELLVNQGELRELRVVRPSEPRNIRNSRTREIFYSYFSYLTGY